MKKAASVLSLLLVLCLGASAAHAEIIVWGDYYNMSLHRPFMGTDRDNLNFPPDWSYSGSAYNDGVRLFDYSRPESISILPSGSSHVTIFSLYNFTDAVHDLIFYVENYYVLYENEIGRRNVIDSFTSNLALTFNGPDIFVEELNSPYTEMGSLYLSHNARKGQYDVVLKLPTPEPSTMLLMGAGLFGFFGLPRRFKK